MIKVQYTSEWDFTDKVTTSAMYNPETGAVTDIEISDQAPEGTCTREYITLPDGTELDVTYDYSDEDAQCYTVQSKEGAE